MSISPYDEGLIAGSNDGSVDDNPYAEGSDANNEWERGFQEGSYGDGPVGDKTGYERALDKTENIRNYIRDNLNNNRYATEELRRLAIEMERLISEALKEDGRD